MRGKGQESGEMQEERVEGRRRRKGFLQGVTLEPLEVCHGTQKGCLSSGV